jgi:tRNA 2-selenouridine synthase
VAWDGRIRRPDRVEAYCPGEFATREYARVRFPDSATVGEIDLFDEVVDVRSPAEYAEDHVPGARSCPVLDDAERAEIGTLYKQVSPFDAKRRGAALVARNIARHLESAFAGRDRGWRPLVYCWRGGKRSGAMTHVLREVGWQAAQLEGGYKAFRRAVVTALDTLPRTFRYVVLCGETGSAKSRVLEALAARGAQVLDLEGLACHRGSVLGGLPGTPQPAQKRFETLVWDALRRMDPAAPVFVEAESKKIGQLQVPDALLATMRAADCARIEAPLAARVAFLIEEYRHFLADPAALNGQLDCLAGLYGRDTVGAWQARADRGDWDGLVGELLTAHYDPAYQRSTMRNYARLADAFVARPRDLAPDSIAGVAEALRAHAARAQAVPA